MSFFKYVSVAKIAALALSLAASLAFGTLLGLVTLHWGNDFILWQMVWWSIISAALGLIAFRLADPILRYYPTYLIPDADLYQMMNISINSMAIGSIAFLASLAISIWVMVAGKVAIYPAVVVYYWPFPASVFLFAAFGPIDAKLSAINDERERARDQQKREERERADQQKREERERADQQMREERERTKRCAEVTSLQRIEFENQFLQAVYSVTAGSTRPIVLGDVWSRLNHECAPELTMDAITVWLERKCIKVNGQFNVDEASRLSLTAVGRDLCMRAETLDSMEEALSERLKGHRVKNEYHDFINVGGVVGTNAHMHDNEVTLLVNAADQLQLGKLAQELAVLRVELLKVATSAEGHIAIGDVSTTEVGLAIGHVSAAETEARKNNPQGVREHLAKVGRWVLDAAKQVGTSLVVEAISAVFKAYNIPMS